MDFFARQDQARRRTGILLAYFIAAVAVIAFSVYLVVAAIFLRPDRDPTGDLGWLWNPAWIGWVFLATLGVIAIGSLVKILELSQGGAVVASALGGRPINPHTTNPDEKRLLNVVEEMAIASGVPVPDVFLLDEESGINAFAAGFKPGDAVIGVTRGAIELLNRDELQGVMAHEFSHILNGDMRLNLRLIGWLNGILCLAVLGYYLVRVSFYTQGRSSGGGRGKGGNPLPLIGLALLIIGWTGVFFGRLIKSAVSRQREFLADAAAVQFTRNPAGLAGALKKLGSRSHRSRVRAPAAEEASHLFFGNGLNPSLLGGLFSTHPPLDQRIRLLDPTFDGRYPPVERTGAPRLEPSPPAPAARQPARTPFAGMTAVAAATIAASQALQTAGQPTFAHLALAGELMDNLSEPLRAAAHEPFGATALVYAMIIARAGASLETARPLLSPAASHEVSRLLPDVQKLPARARLPLLELSLPALRQLSPSQFEDFDRTVHQLVEADSEINLFEYAALKLLARHLTPHFRPARQRTAQYYSLAPLVDDCVVLLSGLAHLGDEDPQAVTQSYADGLARLDLDPALHPLHPLAAASLPAIDAAIDRLALLALPLRRRVLDACAHATASNGVLAEREAELLRAIADTLECPVPPFLRPA